MKQTLKTDGALIAKIAEMIYDNENVEISEQDAHDVAVDILAYVKRELKANPNAQREGLQGTEEGEGERQR